MENEEVNSLGNYPISKFKKCTKCKQSYLATSEFFYKRNTAVDGLDSWCKNCKKEYDNKHNERKRLEKYDITTREYEKMRIEQDNKCAICGIDFDYLNKIKKDIVPRTGKPRIDHDHRSGKVRGLLCSDCNIVLGCFKDNPLIILKAINYLREHKK